MKILLITDLYPVKEDEKTTPKTLFNFVKEWENQGHTVDIIKPNFIFNSFWRKKPFYKTGQYGKVLNINYWTPFWFNVKSKICKYKFDYDLVIAHMPSGILFANKLNISFVAGIHNSDLKVLTKPVYKFFRKNMINALKKSKAIACRSYVIKNKFLSLYPEFQEKTFVCLSGIQENIITEPTFSKGSKIKILTCANLKKRKNIDKLIKACKCFSDVELTVIGDGQIKKQLEKLDKSVKFKGWLNPEQIYKEMQNNNIFILPSINETFGMVYLEAMANNCVTVCTQNDGIDGIIRDGENGFLTEPTIEGIKNTILKIKNMNPEELMEIKNNCYHTIKKLTSEKCATEYLQQIFKIS